MMCFDRGTFDNLGGAPLAWLQLTLDVVVMFLIFSSNILIVGAVLKYWSQGKVPQSAKAGTVFVINMSLSGILEAVSGSYFLSFHFICAISEGFGREYLPCLFRFTVVITAHFMAAFCNILITWDRYLAFVYTMAYDKSVTVRRTTSLVVLVWLLSFLLGHLIFVWNKWEDGKGCHEFDVIPKLYLIIFGVLMYTAVMVSIGVAHWKIHKVTSELKQRQLNKPISALKSKPAFAMISVIPVYLITWAPYLTAILFRSVGVNVPNEVLDLCVTFCSTSYLLIPMRYSWYNIAVKNALLDMYPILRVITGERRNANATKNETSDEKKEMVGRPIELSRQLQADIEAAGPSSLRC